MTSLSGADNYSEKDDNGKRKLYQFHGIGKRSVEDVPEDNVCYSQQDDSSQYNLTDQPAYITSLVQGSLNTIGDSLNGTYLYFTCCTVLLSPAYR